MQEYKNFNFLRGNFQRDKDFDQSTKYGVVYRETRSVLQLKSLGFQRANEVRYSLDSSSERVAYIQGIFVSDTVFHIQKIRILHLKSTSVPAGLGTLFTTLEEDLLGISVEKITADVIERLAPIVEKRYGFVARRSNNLVVIGSQVSIYKGPFRFSKSLQRCAELEKILIKG